MKRVWLTLETMFFVFAASSGWRLWRIENRYAAAHRQSAGTAHLLAAVGLLMIALSVGAIVVAVHFIRRESSPPTASAHDAAVVEASQAA